MSDLRTAIEKLPLYDPDDRITTMDGRVRELRTMADAAEAMLRRVLALIPEDAVVVGEMSTEADRILAIIENHHPEIGTDISDSTWLECSCGWDSSKPKAVDWHQHLVDAIADRLASKA